MKKTDHIVFLSLSFIAVLFISSCHSKVEKDNNMAEQAYYSRRDSKDIDVPDDSISKVINDAKAGEQEIFTVEFNKKTEKNRILIDDLKTKIKKSGKKSDMLFEKRIYILDQKNKQLNEKLNSFDEAKIDWETFTNEIKDAMEELEKELIIPEIEKTDKSIYSK